MAEPSATDKPTPRPSDDDAGSIRETLESITIAFILAFIFRAFIVEAFVIPTGSMAPTLLGQHVVATCPACGYEFTMGPRDEDTDKRTGNRVPLSIQGNPGNPLRFDCPMCRYPITENGLHTNAGDRILVLKYIYMFREPERWDVVVFKNPEDPDINYIKRLVGLPGEELLIAGGDIYTRKLKPDGEPNGERWQIQSKPDHVQRVVWQPVYHSNYFPIDRGRPSTMMSDGPAVDTDRDFPWTMPWQPAEGEFGGRWRHEADGPRFVFTDPDGKAGTLAFRFDPVASVGRNGPVDPRLNYYAYNSILSDSGEGPRGDRGFQDMRLAATVVPADTGLRLTLTGSTFDRYYRALVEADGQLLIQTAERADPARDLDPLDVGEADAADQGAALDALEWDTVARSARAVALPARKATRVELWQADGELSFWIDGERVRLTMEQGETDRVLLPRDAELELKRAQRPADSAPMPVVRLTVQGPAVTLRAVDLDRDLYYTVQAGARRAHHLDAPARIHEGYYFCLGDNSPWSRDGRLWTTVDEWVHHLAETNSMPEAADPDAFELAGYVPEDLMIGRAFFVYFPAAFRLLDRGPGVIPNFGDMRFIR